MAFSVPLLLNIVDAIVYRLDTIGTRGFDPPGASAFGYDDAFREPVVFDETGGASVADRKSSRAELSPVRIPCQVETSLYQSLSESFQGNLNQTEMALVFHRKTLHLMNLIDDDTGNVSVGVGDRIARLEKHNLPGVLAIRLPDPDGLYVTQVMPRSWGFGDDGYDLHVVIVSTRVKGTT